MSIIATFAGALEGVADGSPLSGVVSGAADSLAGVGLRAISSWVLDGTRSALEAVARIIGSATEPNLSSTWFSATYWRVAALAAVLTLPFLFAAAIQALMRSDLALLTRAAFGYLPLSLLAVSVAAPVTMLLLAATDQMSTLVSASGTAGGARFLDQAAAAAIASPVIDGSPFFAVVIGVCAVMAALTLALELLVREAAVYVVVLMLPLAFAAMVWPARRIWTVRITELLVSLILSKFVIVAVLTLAGAAFAGGAPGVSELLVAMALLLLSVFAPWTLLRILPFTELAASAAGSIRREVPAAADPAQSMMGAARGFGDAAGALPGRLRQQAADAGPEGSSRGFPPGSSASRTENDSGNAEQYSVRSAGGSAEPPDPEAAPSASASSPQTSRSAQPPHTEDPPTSAGTGAAPAMASPHADLRPPLSRPWAAGDTDAPLALGPDFVQRGFGGTPASEAASAPGDGPAPGGLPPRNPERQGDSHTETEGSL